MENNLQDAPAIKTLTDNLLKSRTKFLIADAPDGSIQLSAEKSIIKHFKCTGSYQMEEENVMAR